MYRHSPVRNARSKGIKIKHVLQVCLLVAVCFWLIFQVKRSHDKKKEFDASDTKISLNTHTRSNDEVVKFGRKDLQPKLEETTKEDVLREDGEEEEQEEHKNEEEEHEENKHEEEEQEENKHEEEDQDEDKIEEEKEDGGGGADDEIDGTEQEKSDVEIDREEVDAIDEEKETEEKENEEKDGQSQTENGGSVEEHDEDGHTHEAREEHYKADDASSAVTHDGRILGTENENGNGTLENSSQNVAVVDNDETAKNEAPSNTTLIQEIGSESNITSLNDTTSIDAHENEPPSNTTVTASDSQNMTEGVTVSGEQAGNSSIATSVEGSSNSTESNSTKTEVESDAGEGETMEGTEESLDTYETKTQDETVDPSHLEEKEVRTDLETLPEIETEGGNSEDTAAE